MIVVRIPLIWLGVIQTAIVTTAGALFDSTTLAALIGGVFLIINTLLTIVLTRYYASNPRERKDAHKNHRNRVVGHDDTRR